MGEHTKSESNSEVKKMSYEELEGALHQMTEQSKAMYMKIQELNTINLFKRLDYLFKIVENDTKFNEEFVSKCLEEIEEIMTIEQTEE